MINGSCAAGIITRNFSKSSRLYDRFALIQRKAADELLVEAPVRHVGNILEIGCGTGIYTKLLRRKFKDALIKAVDKSESMLRLANSKPFEPGVEFIRADAERMELRGKFDFITSNASFHWFDDIDNAIGRFGRALHEGGVLSFSTFGPGTFVELGYSLSAAMAGEVSVTAASFPGREEIEEILRKHFRESSVREKTVKETFSSLPELLESIRHTGVRGAPARPFLWKKDVFKKAQDIYRARFGKIEASYQILFCRGEK